MSTVPSSKTMYRIVSKAPGQTHFKFRHFSGALTSSPDAARKRVDEALIESPGWQFRIERRTVTSTGSVWIHQ